MKCVSVGWIMLLFAVASMAGCADEDHEYQRDVKSNGNMLADTAAADESPEHLSAVKLNASILASLDAGDDTGWSQVVNGVRARLKVLPPSWSEEPNSPFCMVFIEFENVDDGAEKHLRFAYDGQTTFQVVDQNDKPLARRNYGPYDVIKPEHEPITLPHQGKIEFEISFPGTGFLGTNPNLAIDLGEDYVWGIPQDGSTYYLAGKLTIEPKEGDQPYIDWSGTLELPKTKIPQVARH